MTKSTSESYLEQLAKSFNPHAIASRGYPTWAQAGYINGGVHTAHPSADALDDAGNPNPFVIQFPPPNVTGTLHMGHAFNQTIMDGLTRYHRMKGFVTALSPGTDQAGIATQIVVERQLDAENVSCHDRGREKFV